VKTFRVEDKIIKVQFWDTAGQEKYFAITRQYYRGAHGVVLVYDITKRESFENITRWINEVKVANNDTLFLLIGNKCDLIKKRDVSIEEGIRFSKENGMSFLETSAATGDNCMKAMQLILQDIHQKQTKMSMKKLDPGQRVLPQSTVRIGDESEDHFEEFASKKKECVC